LGGLADVHRFLLSASDGCGGAGRHTAGTPLTGWQAFTSSIYVLVGQPLIIIAEPRTLLFLAFPFLNLAMLIAPVVLAWDEAWLLSGLFLLLGLLPWVFPKTVTGDLFVGFYCWDCSFFAMCIACVLVSVSRRMFYAREIRRLRESAG